MLIKGTIVNTFLIGDNFKKSGRYYYNLTCSCGRELSPSREDSILKRESRCKCPPRKGDICGKLTFLKDLGVTKGRRYCSVRCNCGQVYTTRVDTYKDNRDGCGKCPNNYKVCGTKVFLDVSTKKYKNLFAIIDKEDYPKVKMHKWYAIKSHLSYYVQASVGKERISLHRLIMSPKKEELVDHISGDTLDNTRINLRKGDSTMNARNMRRHKSNTSGRVGVCKRKGGKWFSYIMIQNTQIPLGYYTDFEEACAARLEAEHKYNFHPNHGRVI